MSMKNTTARWSLSKHRVLAIVGGISLLIWGLSGLTHVAMVLFGPQQAQFLPPRATVALAGAQPIATTLARHGIAEAVAVKTVPAAGGGVLWQVTTQPLAERRYFRPSDGAEIADGDEAQADFLARHYLATDRAVTSAVLQTAFDADYPWVNRLLPVWKLRFAGDDGLTAYVHTETSSLAAVNNHTKNRLQAVFRTLHTWEWVPERLGWLRVAVIFLMVGSLLAIALTGLAMLVTIRRKARLPGARGWHRRAGYVLALPLILFSASGLYHLVQSAVSPAVSNLAMGRPIDVASGRWPVEEDWARLAEGRRIAGVALVEGAEGQPLYRIALAPSGGAMGGGMHDHGPADAAAAAESGRSGHDHGAAPVAPASARVPTTDAEMREARFAGIRPDGPAILLDAATGEPAVSGDRDLALAIARRFTGAPDGAVRSVELVTRFSHDYDFRNKRLPVWRVDYGTPVNASLFVDPGAGVLVDRVSDWEKPERLVFSLAHKWNFLFPVGRLAQNAVVAGVVLALIAFMAVPGLRMRLVRRGRKRNTATG
ncbi:PepSY domain-containing protein [Erythrobacteraceae bacterium CFH 75059]|uniref:PepSY domain-containing protein n=1 Tax=Qipengyuania thermophila TaxID=2509361 RepID=UPI001021EAD8|nr:PepSY domain-containing protein [Qipengyuania thermophila]TCD04977.1 PepSY domain-containing protein [Erythrobacteraceae bacterium CFH 75059]